MVDYSKPIAIGSDHAGFLLKEVIREYLVSSGAIVKDFGTFSESSMDYPDTAHPLARAIDGGEFGSGILMCGSGNGMAITANKYLNVRAALCWKSDLAALARQHNDANILVLPARFITREEALECVTIFFSMSFEGGRHAARVEKITHIV